MDGEFHLPRLRKPPPVPKGLEAWLERAAGSWVRWRARRIPLADEAMRIVASIARFEGERDEHLERELAAARMAWSAPRGRTPQHREQALAAIGAVAVRELGLVPHREQVMGVLGLERGWLIEMATGEGKTLTLAMAAILSAWRGQPCHMLTANDYLAGRDAGTLRGVYARCGVNVTAITSNTSPAERQARYRGAVVYTTSRELVGDFLRDRLRLGRRVTPSAWRPWLRRHGQRLAVLVPRLHTVLVDEADQVLIDDAVTPLIISAPRESAYVAELCQCALDEARELREGIDYQLDVARREARIDKTVTEAKATEGRHPLLRVPRWREDWLGRALIALHTYEEGKHYFIREGKVVLIDEATGRPMPDRSLGEGMHALLEAKEGLRVSAPSETLASLSFQRFFRQVPRLAGVTGTASDAAVEFWQLYRLPVVAVPTHLPVRRRIVRERGFVDETAKWRYVVRAVAECRALGQPVLIGTRTVAASEALAAELRAARLPFTLLNAVRNADEAGIVAAAGQAGQITIATNMAGRGTDIVPTNDALAAGGLRVVATERHGSRRVDRQLYGRCGRQGQPGAVEPLASWDDEVVRHHLPRWWRNAGMRLFGCGAGLRTSLDVAQWRASRREAARRLEVLRHDQWLDEHLSLGSGPRSV